MNIRTASDIFGIYGPASSGQKTKAAFKSFLSKKLKGQKSLEKFTLARFSVLFYSPLRFQQISDNYLELGDEPNSDSDNGFSEGQPFHLD